MSYLCCEEQDRNPIVEKMDFYKMSKKIEGAKESEDEKSQIIEEEDLNQQLVGRHTLN